MWGELFEMSMATWNTFYVDALVEVQKNSKVEEVVMKCSKSWRWPMGWFLVTCCFCCFFSKVWNRKVLGRQWYDTDKPLWMIECAVPIEKVPCFVHKNVLQKYHPPKHPETNSSLTIPIVGRWISFRARPIFRGEFLVRGAWTKIDMILIQICVTYCRLSRSSFVQSNIMVFICQLLCQTTGKMELAMTIFPFLPEKCINDVVGV